jgi:hypothetical protein
MPAFSSTVTSSKSRHSLVDLGHPDQRLHHNAGGDCLPNKDWNPRVSGQQPATFSTSRHSSSTRLLSHLAGRVGAATRNDDLASRNPASHHQSNNDQTKRSLHRSPLSSMRSRRSRICTIGHLVPPLSSSHPSRRRHCLVPALRLGLPAIRTVLRDTCHNLHHSSGTTTLD